ncbi:hypothetical protein R6Q57_023082 [Mikania cordata]
MKALRFIQTLANQSLRTPQKSHFNPTFLSRFYASQPLQENPVSEIEETHTAGNNGYGFDSSHYELPDMNMVSAETHVANRESNWEEKHRRKANIAIFREEHEELGKGQKNKKKSKSERVMEQEEKRRRTEILSRALLEAAVAATDEDEDDDDSEVVKVEDQLSLSVGIIGAPNAGKSALTNFLVCLNFINAMVLGFKVHALRAVHNAMMQ